MRVLMSNLQRIRRTLRSIEKKGKQIVEALDLKIGGKGK